MGLDHYKTVFIVDGQVFERIIDIGVSSKGATYYGMTNIKKVTSDSGKYLGLLLDHNKSGLTSRGNLSDITIPQNDTSVNDSISNTEDKGTGKHFSLKNVLKLDSVTLIDCYMDKEHIMDYGLSSFKYRRL